jgi:hypothetical protein
VVEEAEYSEKTTDHEEAIGKIDPLRLCVKCTLFVIYKKYFIRFILELLCPRYEPDAELVTDNLMT